MHPTYGAGVVASRNAVAVFARALHRRGVDMNTPRVLVIGIDGFEATFADDLVAGGDVPTFAALRERGAHMLLDHGAAGRTGLTWEHFWSGLDPDAARRWSSVEFDPSTYRVWAEGARFAPFFGDDDVDAVVLDAPYADFGRAPQVRGVVGWGAHDPGITSVMSNPAALHHEMERAVGAYPATEWLYGCPWPSEESTAAMVRGLADGIAAHGAAARWLFTERACDWNLAIVVFSELHAAAEGLWHGIDPNHPLHHHPSSPIAAAGMVDLYRTVDRVVGDLIDSVDAPVVVFSMGGMGTNGADIPSMVLLPELLTRWALGGGLLKVPAEWTAAPDTAPLLHADRAAWLRDWYPRVEGPAARHGLAAAADRLPEPLRRKVRDLRSTRRASGRPVGYQSLDWIPGSWYRDRWPEMRAFAIPSFYDGRVRVNLRGREDHGVVDLADYDAVCTEIEELVCTCTDPRTGDPVVEIVERPGRHHDPMTLDGSTADLIVAWRGTPFGLLHPLHGLIGPVPYRRTGGHTGPYGFASFSGPKIVPGDYGVVSSFDIAPTVLELVTGRSSTGLSGTTIADRIVGESALTE
jgi:predicted AlkP superfamily phosphohydrolase/phosphomutase